MSQETNGLSSDRPSASGPPVSEAEYKVGPGRPPKEFQFKPGQSGNPKGAKRKPPSMAPDLKLLLERALSKQVTLKQGEKERMVTMAAAGIEQLVAQFAKGDRHARRDVIALADKLGVDLVVSQTETKEAPHRLTREEIARLSDETQEAVIRVTKEVNRVKEQMKRELAAGETPLRHAQ